ncbi:MAG: hypothetical protein KAT77_06445 [Nanoarchaeota archaeon]|nr:hypothetical protein [Nanoarchaeota archaeon]
MDEVIDIEELTKRLEPIVKVYQQIKGDFGLQKRIFGATISSDIDNVLALASYLSGSKVTPEIDITELAQRINAGVVPEIDYDKLTGIVVEKVAERLEGKLGEYSGNVPYAVVQTFWGVGNKDVVQETNDILKYLREEQGWEARESDELRFEKSQFDDCKDKQYQFVIYEKDGDALKIEIFPNEMEIGFKFKEHYPDFESGLNHFGEIVFVHGTKENLRDLMISLHKKFAKEFNPEDTFDLDDIKLVETYDGIEREEGKEE